MSVLVTDAGFAPADPTNWDAPGHVFLPSDTDPAGLPGLARDKSLIGIGFPGFGDGRGFTLARLLRLGGYKGRLHAVGHVLADQYAMARRAGFDAVEIDDALAARQPADQWQARANWQANDYQARLRQTA